MGFKEWTRKKVGEAKVKLEQSAIKKREEAEHREYVRNIYEKNKREQEKKEAVKLGRMAARKSVKERFARKKGAGGGSIFDSMADISRRNIVGGSFGPPSEAIGGAGGTGGFGDAKRIKKLIEG